LDCAGSPDHIARRSHRHPKYRGALRATLTNHRLHDRRLGAEVLALDHRVVLLKDLAAGCAADHTYEFFLAVPPLNITHGTGSPINPLAITCDRRPCRAPVAV
jgi:hypothetical protein